MKLVHIYDLLQNLTFQCWLGKVTNLNQCVHNCTFSGTVIFARDFCCLVCASYAASRNALQRMLLEKTCGLFIDMNVYSTASSQTFADNARFPTVLALGPSAFSSVAQALYALMQQNGWTSISVICDHGTGDPILPYFCKILQIFLEKFRSKISVLFISMDSSKDQYPEHNLTIAMGQSSGTELTLRHRKKWETFLTCMPLVQFCSNSSGYIGEFLENRFGKLL